MKGIGKLFPPNIIPLEIEADHPKRMRALLVDSANPVTNYANTTAQRRAMQKLDLLVVVEVAMTETAQIADYVLPAQSQYEKMEATFFNLEFPKNFFHLRHPVAPPLANTLPEPEIYHRIVTAMGEIPKKFPFLAAVAKLDRKMPKMKLLPLAMGLVTTFRPKWKKYPLLLLTETLGKALPYDYAKPSAFIWGASHMFARKYEKQVRRAGFEGKGYALGEALFKKILESPSGTVVSHHTEEEHWELVRHKDRKVHLSIPEMLNWLDELPKRLKEEEARNIEYPFNLLAGERRSYNANGILRNPEWRKKDKVALLKINPADAEAYAITDGEFVYCISEAGEIRIKTLLTDEVPEGLLSMPHGYGFTYPGQDPDTKGHFVNTLTSTHSCDPLAKTPYHKNVRVKLQKIEA